MIAPTSAIHAMERPGRATPSAAINRVIASVQADGRRTAAKDDDGELRGVAKRRRDHRRASGVDGVDDLGAADALQVDPAPRGAMRKEMKDEGTSHPCRL
jgi:hypothetical protein